MRRPSPAELIADGIVHGIGLTGGLVAGTALLVLALVKTAPDAFPALLVYVASFVGLFGISAAFNLWPVSPVKAWLARFDQAAIFLFIAGTYTPFLALIGGTPRVGLLTALVWGASIVGVALKLVVPQKFGRLAILLYLAIGWSGVLVFHALASELPRLSIWLIVAGGIVYSVGIIFHLCDRLKFRTAVWHGFVVVAAALHFVAILDCVVISRL
jgi:hemolysin III